MGNTSQRCPPCYRDEGEVLRVSEGSLICRLRVVTPKKVYVSTGCLFYHCLHGDQRLSTHLQEPTHNIRILKCRVPSLPLSHWTTTRKELNKGVLSKSLGLQHLQLSTSVLFRIITRRHG